MPYDPARHGPQRIVGPGFHGRVHDLVRTVPRGAVTTFGDVATALGSKNVARHVGYALAALAADSDVPWWRVITSTGALPRRDAGPEQPQVRLLAGEGVTIANCRVLDFDRRRHAFADAGSRAPGREHQGASTDHAGRRAAHDRCAHRPSA